MAKNKNFVLSKKPPPAKVLFAEYREEQRKTLREIGKAHVRSREQVVANFSSRTKPKFRYRTTLTIARLALEILVEEADRERPIWKWLNETGTKAHKIRPKPSNRAQRLFFAAGKYLSKTGANPARFGGSGIVQNPKPAVARWVWHPGFPARKFDEAINRDIEPDAEKQLKAAGRRGLRRAKRKR